MKVTVIVRKFPKLSETFILNQIRGIIDSGHKVSIVADSAADEDEEQSIIQEYNLKREVRYHDIPTGTIRKGCHGLIQAASIARYHPKILRSIVQNQWRSPKKGIQTISRAKVFLSQESDIIHSHFGSISRYCADLKRDGVITSPLIASFHGVGIRHAKNVDENIYANLFQQADLILANSKAVRDDLLVMGANDEKVRLHYQGVELQKFPFKKSTISDSSNEITVLSVGRLTEEKGHLDGLQAMRGIISKYPDKQIHYRIVGGGKLRGHLEDEIERLNIADNVNMCGPKTHEGVIEEMKEADILLHPSRSEGFGMVLLEAQAMGLPIVATDVGGIPEAVDENKSALLCPKRDTDSLGRHLSEIIESGELASKLSRSGREYIEENYSMEMLNKELINLYESVI